MDRVNGELAMSRALGDYQYKDNEDLDKADQMVSCYPDIAVHTRSTTDHLLLLACDGVWDVISNCQAISYLQDFVIRADPDVTSEGMAESLIELALEAGSTDNISAIVVQLSKQHPIKNEVSVSPPSDSSAVTSTSTVEKKEHSDAVNSNYDEEKENGDKSPDFKKRKTSQ